MDNRTNTIAGWVLAAGIVALGSGIVASEAFHSERPETMGYPIEGVVEEGAGGAAAVEPIANRLANADVAKGEQVFAKCAACHNATKGGPNGIGPNLWGAMFKPHGHVPGFAYSEALKAVPGTWTWEAMDEWLTSPRRYAEGTKMTFAGLSDPQDRANIIAYLNQQSDAPAPLPAAVPAADPAAEGAEAAPTGGQKAADVNSSEATPAPGAPSQDDAAQERAADQGLTK
jgi:cytochrome c